jgi:ADP-ribosylglycohydrolase
MACIAGGISGAYLGIGAIPDDWIKRIEKSDYLDDLAVRLTKKLPCRNRVGN